jgi:hypothetical protein
MVDVPALTVKPVGPLMFHAVVVPPVMVTVLLPRFNTRALPDAVDAKLTTLTVWLLVVSVPWTSEIALQVKASLSVAVAPDALTVKLPIVLPAVTSVPDATKVMFVAV